MSDVRERVEKLMRLALNNPDLEEARSAAMKAVALIVEHKLLDAVPAKERDVREMERQMAEAARKVRQADEERARRAQAEREQNAYWQQAQQRAQNGYDAQQQNQNTEEPKKRAWGYDIKTADFVHMASGFRISEAMAASYGITRKTVTEDQLNKLRQTLEAEAPAAANVERPSFFKSWSPF